MTKRDKTTVEDIIGIVHTDETTNSVEEVKKLRGRTNERFIVDDAGTLIDIETRNTYDYVGDVVGLLNQLNDENKHLKADKQSLIDFIRKEFPKSYKHILEGFND